MRGLQAEMHALRKELDHAKLNAMQLEQARQQAEGAAAAAQGELAALREADAQVQQECFRLQQALHDSTRKVQVRGVVGRWLGRGCHVSLTVHWHLVLSPCMGTQSACVRGVRGSPLEFLPGGMRNSGAVQATRRWPEPSAAATTRFSAVLSATGAAPPTAGVLCCAVCRPSAWTAAA